MKFRGIKQFVSEANAWREVSDALRDLFTGIYKLSFADNFESFEVTNVTIGAGATATFANPLGVIPTRYLIVRNSAGMPIGDNGYASWTANTVTLKNSGASSTIITAIFLR